MKSRTIYTIGILAAVLTITTVPELALARGGSGGGGGKGNCNRSAGMNTAQTQNSYQNQGKQQNKLQKRYQNQQNVGSSTATAENSTNRGSGVQDRTRSQLRDPATHSSETTE